MSLWAGLGGFTSILLIMVGRAAHCECYHSLAGIPVDEGSSRSTVLICQCCNHPLQTSATFTSHSCRTVSLIWEPRQSLKLLLLGYFITATGKEAKTRSIRDSASEDKGSLKMERNVCEGQDVSKVRCLWNNTDPSSTLAVTEG